MGFDVVKDGKSLVDTSLVTNVTMGLLLRLYKLKLTYYRDN